MIIKSQVDVDGDLLVQRKPNTDLVLSEVHLHAASNDSVTTFHRSDDGTPLASLRHSMATPLSEVGLQVWAGSALLADYILLHGPQLQGCTAVELGAGTGLAGVLLSRWAARVYLTDVGGAVLTNCLANANCVRNPALVRRLDWLDPPDWLVEGGGDAASPGSASDQFEWTPADREAAAHAHILLAGDVVYENTLTEAFMRTAALFLAYCQRCRVPRSGVGPAPLLLVALEKRPCFTLSALEVRAPAYEFWRTLFTPIEDVERRQPPALGLGLVGRRVNLAALPQTVADYHRTENLELWELFLAPAPGAAS